MIELIARRLKLADAVEKDYEALHEGAALVDVSDRGRLRFHGPGARDALNGLLTCDVAALQAGQGAYGVALTNKGKVIADVTVFASENAFLVESPPAVREAWTQLVTKFVNPRLAKRTDETDATAELAVLGAGASTTLERAGFRNRESLDAMPLYSHVDLADRRINVARIPDGGVEGFRLIVPREDSGAVRDALLAAGARAIGPDALTVARIEAGRPQWGIDMDDSTLPQEANLEALGAISYTKGCYTGQEVVARLHFRGHVNKRLVGLRIEGATLPDTDAAVLASDGRDSGTVRSAAISPRFGVVALAMIRREVAAGDMVSVTTPAGPLSATVTNLPFNS